MNIRSIMRLVVMMSVLFLSACTTVHKVNVDAIKANRDKQFKIGIVKVAGGIPMPGVDNISRKRAVLQKIPVKEICDVLESNYGFKINTEFNREIKTVEEKDNQDNFTYDNPYWGNKEYKKPGFLGGVFQGTPSIIDEDAGDIVFITYSFKSGGLPWAMKNDFNYEIVVKSDGAVLVRHKGGVASVGMAKKGLFIDSGGCWNNFAAYAEKIPEALSRDIQGKE